MQDIIMDKSTQQRCDVWSNVNCNFICVLKKKYVKAKKNGKNWIKHCTYAKRATLVLQKLLSGP